MMKTANQSISSPRKKGTKKKAAKRDATGTVTSNTRPASKRSKYEEEMAFENTISRILLHRFEYDIARLFSTHVHRIAESQLPRLIMSALQIAPPGWIALNAASEEVKDCKLPLHLVACLNGYKAALYCISVVFRGALALDMRQAGERVATKSVLWSYTAIRHFVR